jgi:hypothetical protein
MRGCRRRQKHQRSEPSIHFLIYVIGLATPLNIVATRNFREDCAWLSNDLFYFYRQFVIGRFFPCATNVFNFSIGTILQWSTLGYCNLNTYEDEEVAFIWQRIGEPLKWRHIRRNNEGYNIEDKIKCTASKLLKSSLAIYHYVKLQQLDDICETRQ